MKIIIADDHTIVRQGIARLLQESFPFAEVAEAEDTPRLLQLVNEQSWDVIISDISMPPGDSGLDAVKEIRAASPGTAVIVMSMHAPQHYAVRAIRAGASGYLSKDTASKELVQAINYVLSGKKYVTPDVAAILADSVEEQFEDRSIKNLSDRELEVLKLLGRGKTVTDIAKELNLSTNTVSSFRTKILEKMNFLNNMELIKYAVDNKLT
ncbi:response regulator [Sediminibacterium soli]|uniref:response regulator n=1 Tax=Sediminibacterium soli TaxID=2698829 RepID=UPI00137A10CB|nr:response regulator transcription factor [Sediminibacterium soli]NCI47572.1 response regulator transcription factor [Sediminibacterium soli]